MLDYLISLGDQDDTEQSTPNNEEFDFDNVYVEYESEFADDDEYDDYDDDEDQGWGQLL